ncbi:hypothetical protein L596_003348 [Steinernema carpocapsae]|uniref:Uncharacterized protein n=1 Tax=Steinernema carpocapsae TaxID=34508 RepID=A0A4V6I7Z9_STECR|nr:hypothetical protein L596_003348 [Steinernema carpocapsae]
MCILIREVYPVDRVDHLLSGSHVNASKPSRVPLRPVGCASQARANRGARQPSALGDVVFTPGARRRSKYIWPFYVSDDALTCEYRTEEFPTPSRYKYTFWKQKARRTHCQALLVNTDLKLRR